MFADDSKCYKVTNHHSDYLHLQQDLDALSNWSLRNELFFQPTKCSNLRISRKRLSPPRSYVLNGINVEVVTAEKDLGIMIANDTSWKDHLVMIVAKPNRMLGFLKRIIPAKHPEVDLPPYPGWRRDNLFFKKVNKRTSCCSV